MQRSFSFTHVFYKAAAITSMALASKTVRLATALTCASLSLLLSTNAHAWWQFCNKTSKTVSVSIVYHEISCWETYSPWEIKGWWVMTPGACKIVYGGDLQDNIISDYYFYAKSSDGTLVWTSNTNAHVVPSSAFKWCWNEDHACGGPCGKTVRFRRQNFDGYDNYTTYLVQ